MRAPVRSSEHSTRSRSRRRATFAVVALMAGGAVAPAPLEAQAALLVSRVDTTAVVVDSTGRATSVFRIENPGAVSRTARIALSLPFGWHALAADSLIVIGARATELAFVPV